MAEFPALPLWTDAYIADTQHLTNEEHGAYLRLLMFAWRSPSCSLPDDDKRLAIMIGVTPKVWTRLKPIVMSFWSLTEGQWTQKKLTGERDYVSASREQKRAAGKASAIAKSLKNNNQGSTGVATGGVTGSQRDRQQPTPTPIPIKESKGLEVFDPSRWYKDSDVETLEKLHPNIEVKIKLSDRSFQEWCFKNNPSDPRKPASNWIDKKQTEFDGLESLKVSNVQPLTGGASDALLKTSIVGGKKSVDGN